ncbi:matrix-remodeling-associated protein 7-like [Argonauta hians]
MEPKGGTKEVENGPYGNIYIICLSILATIVIMVISAMYTIRNIKRIWLLGNKKTRRRTSAAPTTNTINKNDQKDASHYDGIEGKDDKKDLQSSQSPSDNTHISEETCPEETNSNPVTYSAKQDPVQFCQHIPSELKKAKQRMTMKNIQLSEKELEEERAIQRHQLEEMFNLMKAQGDKFGLTDINEMKQQMHLYSIH